MDFVTDHLTRHQHWEAAEIHLVQHAWAATGLCTAKPRVGPSRAATLEEVAMLKPTEPTDTWPGAGHADTIAQWDNMRLVRYEPRGPRRHPVPVLIVSPLIAKPYVLDLAPELSLVDHLVERGLELFLLDFGIPDSRDRHLRFEDHLRVVDLAMNDLLAQTGAKRATLLGYCLGGIFATVYAATHPGNVQNLVAMATPIDFSRAGLLYRYVRTLDVDGLVDRLGNVPGEWIRDRVWAFTTLTMPARNLRIWNDFLLHFWDPRYLERQRLVSRWLNDLVPFPGEAYRQFVKELVQANKLVRGELVIDGNAADPSQITCPVLVLAHTGDVLAPPESAQALLEVVSSADREVLMVSGGTLGHVDIVVGPEGPAIMWPKLSAWLEARSGAGR